MACQRRQHDLRPLGLFCAEAQKQASLLLSVLPPGRAGEEEEEEAGNPERCEQSQVRGQSRLIKHESLHTFKLDYCLQRGRLPRKKRSVAVGRAKSRWTMSSAHLHYN